MNQTLEMILNHWGPGSQYPQQCPLPALAAQMCCCAQPSCAPPSDHSFELKSCWLHTEMEQLKGSIHLFIWLLISDLGKAECICLWICSNLHPVLIPSQSCIQPSLCWPSSVRGFLNTVGQTWQTSLMSAVLIKPGTHTDAWAAGGQAVVSDLMWFWNSFLWHVW